MARVRACGLCFLICLFIGAHAARGADVAEARASLYANYAQKLTELAAWCREHQQPEAAEQLHDWLPKRAPEQLTLFLLPSADSDDDAKDAQAEWRVRWQVLRDAQADALFALAKQAIAEHRPSLAFELATEAVRENPLHKLARRVLGYVKLRGVWRTPFEIKQLSAGKFWHEQFGWIPKLHVARYEKGQRYYQGRWLAAADEAALRTDVKRGWRVESEHYVVTTNHSLEEGISLSRKLEAFYSIWQQVFIGYLNSEKELTARFEGGPARRDAKQHNVVYYRTREEYNDALRSSQPQIDITLGIYFASARTAYFFAGKDQEPGTLYHEATHQLFQETRPVIENVGRSQNFWMVEGIACYMESLTPEASCYTLGGPNSGRMPAARHRLLEDNFYVPLAELVSFGMETLQRDPRIAKLYSQSSGLTDFFMHDRAGRYREPLVQYLEAIYTGRATSGTLAELTKTSYPTLDQQYRAFMSADPRNETSQSDAAR